MCPTGQTGRREPRTWNPGLECKVFLKYSVPNTSRLTVANDLYVTIVRVAQATSVTVTLTLFPFSFLKTRGRAVRPGVATLYPICPAEKGGWPKMQTPVSAEHGDLAPTPCGPSPLASACVLQPRVTPQTGHLPFDHPCSPFAWDGNVSPFLLYCANSLLRQDPTWRSSLWLTLHAHTLCPSGHFLLLWD